MARVLIIVSNLIRNLLEPYIHKIDPYDPVGPFEVKIIVNQTVNDRKRDLLVFFLGELVITSSLRHVFPVFEEIANKKVS